MKTISIFLALINSLLAGLLITWLVSSIDFQTSPLWWSMFRILIAASIILIGFLTWIDSIVPVNSSLMALSSLALVSIGAGTLVWIFQRTLLTGGLEYYMVLYGGSLFMQGSALLFGASQGERNSSVA